jgi:arginyl-tRNA--protein-N-Asp/Glu arginylyltransferase
MINEYFRASHVPEAEMDLLWAEGWRHFGVFFFRYSVALHDGALCHVLPLRVDLAKFLPSRSQKRVLARNDDLQVVIRDAVIDPAREALFDRHRKRFKDNVPDSLRDFLSDQRLLAISFLDIGESATSAVYAAFEPSEHKRSLGIFTMLCAIEHSRSLGCRYYYPGYVYREPSMYDYKKRFSGAEFFDWESGWKPLDSTQTSP